MALTCGLTAASSRQAAARALAQHLGAEELFIFVRDGEHGALVLAPGFTLKRTAEPSWQNFLAACRHEGVHTGELTERTWPAPRPATGLVLADGTLFPLHRRAPGAR